MSRLARAAIAACATIALHGCGLAPVQENWNARANLPALPVVYVEVARAQLAQECGNHPGMYLHGCARRDYAARVCTIVTGPRPEAWLLDHERKHCAGWDHGPPATISG